ATRKAVVIASTDLSHFPNWADANVVDKKVLEAVSAMNPYRLDEYDRQVMSRGIPDLVCTVCGLSALKTTILAANLMGANQGQLLHYANSGDITKDKKRVVGYASLAFVKNPKQPALKIEQPKDELETILTDGQKQELINIARAAITEGLARGKQLQPTTAQAPLLERHAVFVTLKRGGALRGCIGMTEARLPLYQGVAQMACAAAFDDPRFTPVTTEELPYLDIEISVLSPLKRIQDTKEIILGIHGVVVKRGVRSGLYLPQVATETGWSKEEFLDRLCAEKAGLPKDIWRDARTELYIFRVLKFEQRAEKK
ncbi:AmmeMemoRadiSam system protein A, partial [candidate division FCPU426 bacterium]|nr:AmmeMemoRadiSam system protein A [candidate division FCPU426 bacterium]